MFIIKPITDKQKQMQCCEICNVEYLEQAMAYEAILNGKFAAVCQFELKKEHGILHHLCPAPGIDDFEMMFIMGRSAMNFIDLCDHHVCIASKSCAEHRLLIAIGFKQQEDETYRVDMTGMFGGCGNH